MKLNSKIIGLMAVPALLIGTGCDNVKEGPDRFEEKDRIESDRCVLVMEFTGQQCPNCPEGAETVHSIIESYPDNVVAVCLHPFDHILTNPVGTNDAGLRSEEASVLFSYYHPEGFPCAVFDGTEMSMSTGSWNKLFRQALIEIPQADIDLRTSYNETSRELKVSYEVIYLDNVNSQSNIQVWITEDNIIAPQFNEGNPKIIVDYSNNHVLRATLTGEWGESLGTSHKAGDVTNGELTFVLPENFVAENCNVVAFAQRTSDKAVLQAAQKPVVKRAE